MLRTVQLGISVQDLDLLDIGLVLDMFAELQNDAEEAEMERNGVRQATQADYDNF